MRERCSVCKDSLFKIVDGSIVCRNGHVKGTQITLTGESGQHA